MSEAIGGSGGRVAAGTGRRGVRNGCVAGATLGFGEGRTGGCMGGTVDVGWVGEIFAGLLENITSVYH